MDLGRAEHRGRLIGKLNAFAYVQSNPQIMYVAGGWGNTPRESPSQAGIYRTTDGGKHWRAIDAGLTNADGTISSVVNGLYIDEKNPSVVLAATEVGGTFRSSNGGTRGGTSTSPNRRNLRSSAPRSMWRRGAAS